MFFGTQELVSAQKHVRRNEYSRSHQEACFRKFMKCEHMNALIHAQGFQLYTPSQTSQSPKFSLLSASQPTQMHGRCQEIDGFAKVEPWAQLKLKTCISQISL